MSDKLYYSIKEVSELLQVPMPTLRYWEKEVKQLQPKTNTGRTRFYTQEDIDILRRIIFLREQNVPIKELSRRLMLDNRVLDKQRQVVENLKMIRNELVTLKNLI